MTIESGRSSSKRKEPSPSCGFLRAVRSRYRLFTVAIFCITVAPGFAADSPSSYPALTDRIDGLSAEQKDALISEGELLYFHDESVDPVLVPSTSIGPAVVEQIQDGELTIGIEGLYLIEDPPEEFWAAQADEAALILYNILRSVSTLEGLEYYSASRGEMRLLFEESWVIDDPKRKRALPDLLVSAVPAEDTIYIHQKDMSFGKNQSSMAYRSADGAYGATIVNLTPMRYKGIFRIVDPGKMQVHLMVIPVAEGILIYGTMAARTTDVKAFKDRARNSFTNRVAALANWYTRRVNEEFGG